MSRSYKKTPYSGCPKNKFMKKYANRRLRRKKLEHDYQHNAYKKHTESWDICDYGIVDISLQEYWERCVRSWHHWNEQVFLFKKEPFPNYEEVKNIYYKLYVRK